MTAAQRAARTQQADSLCVAAFEQALGAITVGTESLGSEVGMAMVAVGGYGRGDLAPFSDLDIVLVYESEREECTSALAERLWYPLWDSGFKVDHAVRSFDQTLATAAEDPRVLLGLLDLRHLAGDPNVTLRLRSLVLAQWRRDARAMLPRLQELTRRRHELAGEIAHVANPDIKEGEGGLRDATVLRGLVATWLVDVPHTALALAHRDLLDIRDRLHDATGRRTDRIGAESWLSLAEHSGVEVHALQAELRQRARRLAHLSAITWRRVEAALAPRAPLRRRTGGPHLAEVAAGVALHDGEVVMARGVTPESDPAIGLRMAAEAAERDVVLNPASLARFVHQAGSTGWSWNAESRGLLIRLLASGRGLVDVWETMDQTGAIDVFLPEWERIRLRPHASVIHRFTVDRHVIETCVQAASLIRQVARPDLLMVAALLHDIGKGEAADHCVVGEPIARTVAIRMGFAAADVARIGTLVRQHLLLAQTATSRDPGDPATVAVVVEAVGDAETLEILAALTQADALATAAKAWSTWRAGLVRTLVDNTRKAFAGAGAAMPHDPFPLLPTSDVVSLQIEVEGETVRVAAADRVGLFADLAAVFALSRVPIRSARTAVRDGVAHSQWQVGEQGMDAALLRQRLLLQTQRRAEVEPRLCARAEELAPVVLLRSGAATQATVLEVRARDRPGLLYQVLSELAIHDVVVRSAHIDTVGPQAVDVFYLQEHGGVELPEQRAASVVHAVRNRLEGKLPHGETSA